MVAIPGMNPGLFVMGGGGDGGGGDGSGGDGKGGKQGANGKNGGKDANGGGKGAGNCGPGSGSGCPNPAHGGKGGTHAGDPVDPITGRVYTVPQTDLPLAGPFVFALQRAYSSFAAERDIGLGFGWSCSLAWDIEVRRRTMLLRPPFQEPIVCDLPEMGATVTVRGVGRLRRDEGGFVLVDADASVVHRFVPSAAEPSRFRLAWVGDRNDNRVAVQEDERGRLTGLTDSAGRQVQVKYAASGRIEAFELVTKTGRRVCYRRYEHDDRGDLVATVDAEGRRTRFVYDEEHRLTDQVLASGREVHWRYDRDGRCVETWTDHGDAADPALADDVPDVLADGITKARGMLHVRLEHGQGTTVMYDSRSARRIDHAPGGKVDLVSGVWVDSLKYDERGDVAAYEDANGRRVAYERDESSRVIGVTGPDGAQSSLTYDAAGDLREVVDALGTVLRYSYDQAGNVLETADAIGALLRCSYDARGLRVTAEMANGGVTRTAYDAEGNVVAVTEPNGKTRRIEVDDVGRVISFTNEEGQRTGFRYDRTNALRAIELPNGGVTLLDVDADGNMASYTSADGGVWKLSWGGYQCVHAVEKPTGEVVRFRYDREANLVQVINERGEVHRIERDAGGRIVGEQHFDGRRYRYELDGAGRIVSVQNGAEETTAIERDANGRVVKRAFDDGSEDVFESDAGGRLLRASSGAVVCEWEYDGRGNVVREKQTHAGRTVTIEHTYDSGNARRSLRTSAGYSLAWERDASRRPVRMHLDGGATIERTYDGLGREVLRSLPRGGHIVCRYDGLGSLIERRIAGPHGAPPEMAPEWVGALPPGTTFAEALACSPGGDVIERSRSDGSREQIRYDLAGRVLSRTLSGGGDETYAYAGSGITLEPQGPKRHYGAGGALLSRGARSYAYDAEGRRSEVTDEGGLATRYEYDGRGALAAVKRPDGSRVENVYDALGRRIVKRVIGADGTLTETRFTWDGNDLVHERTTRLAPGGGEGAAPEPVSERWYVFDDTGVVIAHRERTWAGGEAREDEWIHYARGPSDMPELLVAGDGAIVGRVRATVWGAVKEERGARTPWRFPGQYFDEETGLCQNRHRFYDPEVGLYITPDPLGLGGQLAAYEYADSRPLRLVDPDGMGGKMASTVEAGGEEYPGTSGVKYQPNGQPQKLHPVVEQALPQTDPNGKNPSSGSAKPGECAEPQALSKYLYDYEKKTGKKLDPNDKEEVQKALNGITKVTANVKKTGEARSPCPNCSQMFANLMDKYGAPDPSVIQPGATTPGSGIPGPTNFEPPQKDYSLPAHQSYPI
jgi:RHS repeat-associated protein